jgi:type III secretion protein R
MKGADLAAWAALLVIVPFLVVLATSFIKFAVVLAILRRALGGSALPPASVSAALALMFALFVMAPVGDKVWAQAAPGMVRGDAAGLALAASQAATPVRAFLQKHAPAKERQSFFELQKQLRPEAERAQVADTDLVVLVPAFATAELKAAFQVGFLLFLPFLLIELVVSAVLLSMGMNTLRPEAVSLPFKLLLFVLADGWHLIARGLVLGYT